MVKTKTKPGPAATDEQLAEPGQAGQAMAAALGGDANASEQAGDTLTADEPSVVIEPKPGELDQVLGDLGGAIARERGKYDLSEEAHQGAIERAEQAASDWVMSADSLVWDARDFLLEQIKRRPKPWSASSGGEQRDIAAACEHAAQELVRKIAEELAAKGQPTVRVLVGQITLGDKIKITGEVRVMGDESEDAAVLFLHRAHGKHVMLTLASKDEHQGGERPAPGVPEEEPALPFEAGGEEMDEEADRDLVEAGGAQPGPHEPRDDGLVVKAATDPLRTGDLITGEGHGPGPIRIRVNLQTGMIEGQQANSADWDIDVRQATPNELSGERNRVADFDDAEQEQEAEPAD